MSGGKEGEIWGRQVGGWRGEIKKRGMNEKNEAWLFGLIPEDWPDAALAS